MRRWTGMLVAGLTTLGVGTSTACADSLYWHDYVATNEEFGHMQTITVEAGSDRNGGTANASAYPSRAAVSGVVPYLADVEVHLVSLNAPVPEDLDIVLVSPNGTAVKLMSDAGGRDAAQSDIAFSATAHDQLTTNGAPDRWNDRLWLPTDVDTGGIDDRAPFPYWTPTTDLRSFVGGNPNGDWRLYITNDGDHGAGLFLWQIGLGFDNWAPSIDGSGLPNDRRVPLHATLRPHPYCHDSQTGIARCEGMDNDVLDTSTLGAKTYRVIAQDGSGRKATREFEYTVVDVEAPTVTLRAPTNGAGYALGQKVIADYDCADEANGSGVATCSGTVPKGSALDTSSLGQHVFVVRTSDRAGNERTVSVEYSVCAAPQLDVLPDPIGGPVHSANCGS